MGKATNFKFGTRIRGIHANKSPLKIGEKRECRRIQGLSKFVEYPLLSQKRTFLVSIGTKAHYKFREK